MIIERTASEFVIRFPFMTDRGRIQDVKDYLRYVELTANSKVTQTEIDEFAREINRNWWEQNRSKFE